MRISFGSCPFTIGGMPRLVDLSAPIVTSPAETPDFLRVSIEFHSNAQGADDVEQMLGVPRRRARRPSPSRGRSAP